MRNIERYKEYYRLWVEYLKESDSYKEFCERRKASKKVNASQSYWLGKREVYDFDYQTARESTGESNDFSVIYRRFGDLHAPDYQFDVWWETTFRELLKQDEIDPYIVKKVDVGGMASDVFDDLQQLNDFSQAEDFLGVLLHEYIGEEKGSITLKFDTYHSIGELTKRFQAIIRKHKKEYKITADTERRHLNSTVPTIISKRWASEIYMYLDVYRKKKEGKKMLDIVKAYDRKLPTSLKGREILGDELRSEFLGFHAKARKIIKNVEKNIFPGPYQP